MTLNLWFGWRVWQCRNAHRQQFLSSGHPEFQTSVFSLHHERTISRGDLVNDYIPTLPALFFVLLQIYFFSKTENLLRHLRCSSAVAWRASRIGSEIGDVSEPARELGGSRDRRGKSWGSDGVRYINVKICMDVCRAVSMYIQKKQSEYAYIYVYVQPKDVNISLNCMYNINACIWCNKWFVRFPDTMVGRVSMMHIFFKELISNRGIAEVGGCCEKCQELRSTWECWEGALTFYVIRV